MRMPHIRTTDLNLLTALEVLLEERHISRAAEQYNLSQPAMSRTLQRLRETFDDELLVRTATGYELTPRARTIQRELGQILPRINALLHSDRFDPAMAADVLTLSGTDYAAIVIGRPLFGRVLELAPQMTLNLMMWHDRVDVDLESGRLDLVLTGIEPDQPLLREVLFDDPFVCVVPEEHPARSRLNLAAYMQCEHIVVQVRAGKQAMVDDPLRAIGAHRTVRVRVPYFTAAREAVADTGCVATLPSRIIGTPPPGTRVVAAPKEIKPFPYYMTWHPRLDGDMTNRWLRDVVRDVVR
jgi:DNA-binding transcriptional LysR family regulator